MSTNTKPPIEVESPVPPPVVIAYTRWCHGVWNPAAQKWDSFQHDYLLGSATTVLQGLWKGLWSPEGTGRSDMHTYGPQLPLQVHFVRRSDLVKHFTDAAQQTRSAYPALAPDVEAAAKSVAELRGDDSLILSMNDRIRIPLHLSTDIWHGDDLRWRLTNMSGPSSSADPQPPSRARPRRA